MDINTAFEIKMQKEYEQKQAEELESKRVDDEKTSVMKSIDKIKTEREKDAAVEQISAEEKSKNNEVIAI